MSARATDVAGDLELGSAGRERPGQAHDQDLLAGARFPDVEEDGRVELEAVLCVQSRLLSRFGRATRALLRPFRGLQLYVA